jgi:hypothetical protein
LVARRHAGDHDHAASFQAQEQIMRTLLGITLATILSYGIAQAGDMQPMSIDRMKAEIIGNSLSGKTEAGDDYVEHYMPDGTIVGMSASSGKYQGRWSFRQDGLMCFKYGDGAFDGGCVHLSRGGDAVGFTRVDGSLEPTATLIQGMAPELK